MLCPELPKIVHQGVPPKLSGFVYAYHPATPGSNPKHTIDAFIIVLYLSCEKDENKQKEAVFGPFFKKCMIISKMSRVPYFTYYKILMHFLNWIIFLWFKKLFLRKISLSLSLWDWIFPSMLLLTFLSVWPEKNCQMSMKVA